MVAAAWAGSLIVVPVLPAGAAVPSRTIAIGVDHSTPGGHNFEYVDYFPRAGVAVHTNDVLDFGWANTPDGLHTATLLKTGETPQQAWQANPLAVPEPTGDEPGLEINPAIGAPTNPACGTVATPCVFDGSSNLNSGAIPTNSGGHFVVKVTAGVGHYTYVCEIHPGMKGSFSVVGANAAATTAGHVRAAARAQARTDTERAFDAEQAVPPARVHPNGDGTHTVAVTAGTATPFVEIAEMLPRRTTIRAGDTIKWITRTIKDPHTVTFPQGSDPSTEPLPNYCEGTPDVLQTGPPVGPPCGDPTKFEIHFNPLPSGGTVISSPSTVATSGVISNPPAPFPTNYSYSFPNAGTFTYQCRIHDHMIGTVEVRQRHGDNDGGKSD
jgi:plastocyanin